MKLAGVYDIECAEWDRFRVGALLGVNGFRYLSWSEDDFFDNLLRQEGVWYAHAGGRYDCLWFLDMCCRRGLPWTAKMRGSGVLCVRMGKLELRDSFALIPMSLEMAGQIASKHRKLSIGLTCECGESCGGFCVLSCELDCSERESVETYLWADCETLLDVLDTLAMLAEREGIELALTVGSSAWKTARKWLNIPACTHTIGRYTSIRKGYYGGRTEGYRSIADSGHRYDIHSSYPAALSKVALPVGKPVVCASGGARKAYASGKPGVYTAKLTIPECEVPPLAVREVDRLIYPHGPIEGTWTGLSLRYAESCGARIESIDYAYVWQEEKPFLAPFAEKVWALRARADEKGEKSLAAWYKWLANSMTGKLAQRPEHTTLSYVPGEAPYVPEGAEIVAVARHGVYIAKNSTRIDACAHVECSATLTSYATMKLHIQLSGASGPLYCDTDSVYAIEQISADVGPDLGQWGYEGRLSQWRCPAPKVYRYWDNDKQKWVVRGKGMPGLDAAGFDALLEGDPWTVNRGVHGLRTAIRSPPGKVFAARSLSRSLHPVKGWLGGRHLEADGTTRPCTVVSYRTRDDCA